VVILIAEGRILCFGQAERRSGSCDTPKQEHTMNEISSETYEAAIAAVTQLQSDLQVNLQSLSAKDRRALPKMGDGSVAFVEKAHEYAKTYGDLVPGFMDVNELTENLNLYSQLQALHQLLNPLVASINDSMLLAGSQSYTASLAFYRNVKNASKMKIKNAKVIHDDLAKRFSGIRQSADSEAADDGNAEAA
jgi:hypothetical protein